MKFRFLNRRSGVQIAPGLLAFMGVNCRVAPVFAPTARSYAI